VVGGLASYWVYQHLGNLAPGERAEDEIWREIASHEGEEEYDATALLDTFAERADRRPETYRWSHSRDFGAQARLVVVDSRAARVLDPARRAMLDEGELAWLDDRLQGGPHHLLVGTSLPFLLAPGLHYVEAFSEALAGGGWGRRRAARAGERLRERVDLEHWAAFQKDFQRVSRMVLEVARGARGPVPRTVTFLSGDVHHSYVSEARPTEGAPVRGRIIQAVCSPIRNPLSYTWRFATAAAAFGAAAPLGHLVARSAKVADAPLEWRLLEGPFFDNVLAVLEITDEGLSIRWAAGEVDDGDYESPRLRRVAEVTIS
jgi:hypothetical protein